MCNSIFLTKLIINEGQMETIYFGIPLKENIIFDAQNVAARLFLCPRISPEHASKMLDLLVGGSLSIDKFLDKTNTYIEELSYKKECGEDIPCIMKNKLDAWIKVYNAPTQIDYQYLEKVFGFTKCDLYGELGICTKAITSPKDLSNRVKQYIKGQDNAIDKLAVPLYLHLDSMRKRYTSKIKMPVVLIGPTGSGKSELIRRCGQFCECPVIRINLSSITPEGWRGTHITDIIAHEIRAGVPIKDLEYAILVFHEFDKITHFGNRITSDKGNDGDMDLMRDLMRFFETNECLFIDTGIDQSTLKPTTYKLAVDNLLIVFDGAFQGIEDIIKKRLDINKTIGFNQLKKDKYESVNLQTLIVKEDLQEWGYIPELIGRIGNIIVMNPLTTDVIYEIMTSAKDSIIQSHIDFCSANNIDLRFEESALRYIANEAYKSGLGFRNAKTLLSNALSRLYFELPESVSDKKIIEISKEYVMQNINVKQ